ncbi:hypothetical protein A3L12_06845 [Thermococcus sp. P6]|nr:hypothetical protein A3L12_06845 [Thermococcus sp. P6]
MGGKYNPYIWLFSFGFAYSFIAKEIMDLFPQKWTLIFLNVIVLIPYIGALQKSGGKSLRIGLMLGFSLILGVLIGGIFAFSLLGGE